MVEGKSYSVLVDEAMKLRMSGSKDEALKVLQTAAENYPTNAGAWYNLGLALFEQGKESQALEMLKKAVGLKHQFPQAWAIYSLAQIKSEGPDKARSTLFGLLIEMKIQQADGTMKSGSDVEVLPDRNDPEVAGLYNNLGVIMLASGLGNMAQMQFNAAKRLNPSMGLVWRNYIRYLKKTKDNKWKDMTKEAYDKGYLESKDVEGDMELWIPGFVRAETDIPDEATLRGLIEKDETDATAWYQLGELLIMEKRHEEAVSALRSSLKYQPRSPLTWIALGKLLVALERTNEAEEALRNATELEPDNAEAWMRLASVLQTLGREADADEAKKKATSLDSSIQESIDQADSQELIDRTGYLSKISVAQNLVNSGRLKEAESVLREALEIGPNEFEANYFLGMIYAKSEKMDECIPYLEKAFAKQPEATNAGLVLGQIYASKKEFEKAHHVLSKMLEIPKHEDDARTMLALVLTVENEHEEAIQHYEKLIQKPRENVQIYEGYGASLAKLGKLQDAEGILLKAKSIKETPQGLSLLADVQSQLGKEKEAEDSVMRALKHRNHDVGGLVQIGGVLTKLNMTDRALTVLDKVLKHDPNQADALLLKTSCLLKEKEYKKAEEIAKQAVELTPERADAWRLYAISMELNESGTEQEIVDTYQKAISFDKESTKSNTELGRYYAKLKRYEEAKKYLTKSYEEDKNDLNALRYLIDSMLRTEQNDDALKLGLSFVEQNPESTDAHDALSHIYVETKEWEKALESVNRTLKINPKHDGAMVHLAETYLGQGKLKEAEKEVKKAMKLKKKDEEGYSWLVLSRIQRAMGKEKDAEKSEKKALSIQPSLQDYLDK
jgi:superkiller protein 3